MFGNMGSHLVTLLSFPRLLPSSSLYAPLVHTRKEVLQSLAEPELNLTPLVQLHHY